MRDDEDLKMIIQASLEQCRKEEREAVRHPPHIEAGGVYSVEQCVFLWAAALRHVDDPALWYMVPIDEALDPGTWDVAIPSDPYSGLDFTACCGRGVWIHEDFIREHGTKIRQLDCAYLRRIRHRLSVLATGEGDLNYREEVDADPDYQERLQEIAQAAAKLERAILEASE